MSAKVFAQCLLYLLLFAGLLTACTEQQARVESKPVVQDTNDVISFWVGDTTGQIHGIDVSHFQKDIDWTKVKEHGVSFVFVKATEGVDYLDTMFHRNWAALQREKIIRGAYHFYISEDDPQQQAAWFVSTVGSFEGVLPPVMDVERAGHKHLTPQQYQEKLLKCLQHVEKLSGRKPILYSSPGFAQEYLISDVLSDYMFWIAEYNVEQPVIPAPWRERGWMFWQYAQQAAVPGVPVGVDRNVFGDKYHKLLALIQQ